MTARPVTGGPYTTVGSVTVTGYTDTGVTNGTEYFYVVTAVNAVGEGAASNQASATPVALPGVPGSLTATAGNSEVMLVWGTATGAASYNVRRGSTSNGPFVLIQNTVQESYTDTGVVNGTEVYYEVTGVNAAGEGPATNVEGVIPGVVPPAPTNLTATASGASVTLGWSASSGATGYNVKRGTTSGGPYTVIGSPVTTSYVDSTVSSGVEYFYVVTAVEATVESGPSNQASVTPVFVPNPPGNLTAQAGDAEATLGWTGSNGATSYNVKRSTTNGGPYTTVGTATGTSYVDTNLLDGTEYFYVVTAVDGAGESGPSNQANVTPMFVPPAPTNPPAPASWADVNRAWTGAASATS